LRELAGPFPSNTSQSGLAQHTSKLSLNSHNVADSNDSSPDKVAQFVAARDATRFRPCKAALGAHLSPFLVYLTWAMSQELTRFWLMPEKC